jgi:hypothetical protein
MVQRALRKTKFLHYQDNFHKPSHTLVLEVELVELEVAVVVVLLQKLMRLG